MSTDDPFTQVALATRTLVELPFQRAIPAVATPEKPTLEGHLSWMLAQAIGSFGSGNQEKAYLWLGFVQGVLAMRGIPLCDLDLANRAEGSVGSYASSDQDASGPPGYRRASLLKVLAGMTLARDLEQTEREWALYWLGGLSRPNAPEALRLLDRVLEGKLSFAEARRLDAAAQGAEAASDSPPR